MRSHRFLTLSVLVALVGTIGLGLCSCADRANRAPKPQRWTLANVHPVGYPTAEGLEVFAEAVAADPLLSGVAHADLQLGGVLGNEKEILEKLRFGGIQLACVSAAPLAEFWQPIGVLTLPYLFSDRDHMWRVLEGEIGQSLLSGLEDSGFIGLAWYESGSRSFYNRRHPIHTLDDLKGLKIRVQKAEIMRDMVAALGASPVAMGFKTVYTNLHTGVLDGAENNLPSYRSERHFEVAKYYSYDRHSTIPDLLLMRADLWRALDPDQQLAVRAAAMTSSHIQRDLWRDYVEAALVEVRAAGVEVNEIADLSSFRFAVQPIYEQYGPAYSQLLEAIRTLE